MKKIENKHVERYFDPTNNLIYTKWFPSSGQMSGEDYKNILSESVDMIEKCRAVGLLTDALDMRFAITPELQNWTVNNVLPRIVAAGLLKQAVILPELLIPQLAVEQVFEEIEAADTGYISRFFCNIEEAKKWLGVK
ncbi:hypothetical protein R9C00_12990 [Flammeovirgaceae bacterium SG7u.111]|nr:hypothetical protein [Flammeovirgaceae bacterium SG7u.132]WPO38371.1 hypothetical protein R9C00_12990 [Flammeovirgaceae bacterium SG7u.111]